MEYNHEQGLSVTVPEIQIFLLTHSRCLLMFGCMGEKLQTSYLER
jgi:hypothetical protein